jgi:hypothetical protein
MATDRTSTEGPKCHWCNHPVRTLVDVQESAYSGCAACNPPRSVPVPSGTGARREEGLSELSEDVAQALSDMQRESRGVGEVGFRPGREMAEREERRARDEAEAEILSLLRAALHRARVAEEALDGWKGIHERIHASHLALESDLAATRKQVETLERERAAWQEARRLYDAWQAIERAPAPRGYEPGGVAWIERANAASKAFWDAFAALRPASPPSAQPTEPAAE